LTEDEFLKRYVKHVEYDKYDENSFIADLNVNSQSVVILVILFTRDIGQSPV